MCFAHNKSAEKFDTVRHNANKFPALSQCSANSNTKTSLCSDHCVLILKDSPSGWEYLKDKILWSWPPDLLALASNAVASSALENCGTGSVLSKLILLLLYTLKNSYSDLRPLLFHYLAVS